MQARSPPGGHPTVFGGSNLLLGSGFHPRESSPSLAASKTPSSPPFWGSRPLSRCFSLKLAGTDPTLLLSPELLPRPKPLSAGIYNMMSFSLVRMRSHHWPIGAPLPQVGPSFRFLSSLFSLFQYFKKWQHPTRKKCRQTLGSKSRIQEKLRTLNFTTPYSAFVAPTPEIDIAPF